MKKEEKKIKEGGQEKDAFVISFTNGALEQLEDLKVFFEKEDNLETIKMAVSFMQLLKEQEEKRKQKQSE